MTGSARRLWSRRHHDEGLTLIELVVAMSLMAVLMVIFTAAVIQSSGTGQRVEAAGTSQSQVDIAFARLDTQLRYAAAVSTPGAVGIDSYVEFLTTAAGPSTCTELRLHVTTGQLQERSWQQGGVPAPTWTPLASGVSGATPFTVTAADSTSSFQRLRVRFAVKSGSNANAKTTSADAAFPALNSGSGTGTSSPSTVCTEGRSVA